MLLMAITVATAYMSAQTGPVRQLRYFPDGRDIVCRDGQQRYTRALYGSYTDFRVETSDRPIFATYRHKNKGEAGAKGDACTHKNIRFSLTTNGHTLWLEQTAHCEARYNAGKRVYLLSDPSWGKGRLTITVMAQPDEEAAIWQFEPKSLPRNAVLSCTVCDVLRPKFSRSGDMGSCPPDSFDPSTDEAHKKTCEWQLGKGATFCTLSSDENGAYTLTTPTAAYGQQLFEKALKHHEWLATNIVFDTPDPYINTLGGALMAAADGAWDGETWLHGAVVWRMQLCGWRAGYLGDVLGLPERAKSHFTAYANSQVTDVEPTLPHPTQDADKALSRAVKTWGTQMYSNGYICRYPNRKNVMHHYDMNLNYIDELLWHFEYDADTVYMRRMWPVLTSHLAWEKRNFDPDDDGLYDAYCCIWASDALYYNSGAVTHSSAYNYRGFTLAARIAEILGEDPTYYKKEAEKTLKAMNQRLWLNNRGHWAEYQDFMGLRRTHDHAALWSIYTPIDCGACTPQQAFQATQYVDSCIPHINVECRVNSVEFATAQNTAPKGSAVANSTLYTLNSKLSTISTTDWQPYDWSINNVAAEEVMHTALSYFQAGRPDEGFALMKANVMDQAYMGGSPGNFGQISFYDKARGELYRDFSDNTGISARAFIQGLYGIVPNALDGRCILRPGFPEEWDHAAIHTPYFSYSYRRDGDKDIYEVEQNFAQPLQIVLRQNTGDGGYVETIGSSERKQTFVVNRAKQKKAPQPLITAERIDGRTWGNNFDDVQLDRLEPVTMDALWNASVSDIFKNFYLSPRSPYTTLQLPVHGIGEWCHPETMADIDDYTLRKQVSHDGLLTLDSLGIPFRYAAKGKNIAYTSLWDNYPDSIVIPITSHLSPLTSQFTHAYLLMAGSTNYMQSHIDNGLVIARYTDGTADTLRLQNPHNWCPIEQDYYEDGLAFHASSPRPYRIDFATAHVSRCLMPMGEHYGRPAASGVAGSYNDRSFQKGAGIILDMPLNKNKQLRDLTVRTLSNDVVIGLMGVTLQR